MSLLPSKSTLDLDEVDLTPPARFEGEKQQVIWASEFSEDGTGQFSCNSDVVEVTHLSLAPSQSSSTNPYQNRRWVRTLQCVSVCFPGSFRQICFFFHLCSDQGPPQVIEYCESIELHRVISCIDTSTLALLARNLGSGSSTASTLKVSWQIVKHLRP